MTSKCGRAWLPLEAPPGQVGSLPASCTFWGLQLSLGCGYNTPPLLAPHLYSDPRPLPSKRTLVMTLGPRWMILDHFPISGSRLHHICGPCCCRWQHAHRSGKGRPTTWGPGFSHPQGDTAVLFGGPPRVLGLVPFAGADPWAGLGVASVPGRQHSLV